MIIKKQLKLTPKKISNWLNLIIIFLTIIILIFVSVFLYNNLFQTIAQTKEIIILRQTVALDMVNMEKFDLIIDKITNKTAPKQLGNITSPFH